MKLIEKTDSVDYGDPVKAFDYLHNQKAYMGGKGRRSSFVDSEIKVKSKLPGVGSYKTVDYKLLSHSPSSSITSRRR